MISREDALKHLDVDKLHRFDYCHIKLKCDDCPFSAKYNNQDCRDSILQYVEKKKKMKEIIR